jgi:hypothetical protein
MPQANHERGAPTNLTADGIGNSSKNRKKTWNFLPCVAVGFFKQLELMTFPLTDNG